VGNILGLEIQFTDKKVKTDPTSPLLRLDSRGMRMNVPTQTYIHAILGGVHKWSTFAIGCLCNFLMLPFFLFERLSSILPSSIRKLKTDNPGIVAFCALNIVDDPL